MEVWKHGNSPLGMQSPLFRCFYVSILCLPLVFGARAGAAPASAPAVAPLSDGIALRVGGQEVRARRASAAEPYRIEVRVRDERGWQTLFDGGRPLVSGESFDLEPTACSVVEDTPQRKCLRLAGTQRRLGYPFEILVRAAAGSPMVRFTVTAHLDAPVPLAAPQPDVALWRRASAADVTLDQGPDSIYRDAGGGTPYNYGFPAAYCWSGGAEAVVFFDLTASRWMSGACLRRFANCRVMSFTREDRAGIGLRARSFWGPAFPAGDLVWDFSLYAGARLERPSRLDALDTMVRVCAPLHPVSASPLPANHREPGKLSWAFFAGQALRDLMVEGRTCTTVDSGWKDAPLALAPPGARPVAHPPHPLPAGEAAPMGWDFSTVNNHLSPWILYTRLHPDARAAEMARAKADALPCFYDPKADLIRWGTRVPPHVGDQEMCWQNLFFHIETARAAWALPPEEFNPAVLGRFLMSADGLVRLAHHVDYLFPQWFDPYAKEPARQADVPKLGMVREPWQAGAYAYVMRQAYEVSGEPVYLDEARRAMERLFARGAYTMENDAYRVTYRDAADYPITELFGNAYGAVAALKVYRLSGKKPYLRYSRAFLDTLLRLTFWYDDRTDAVSSSMSRLGLFLPHAGAACATPWESVEAHLALAWLAGHDPDLPLLPLLLKLANCCRTSAFYFCPPAFPDAVRALDPGLAGSETPYLPIEPFYSLEAPGGHRGPQAAYMANLLLWNHWLFDAVAVAEPDGILALNTDTLDGYDAALGGAARHVILYNPGERDAACRLRCPSLPAGRYAVEVRHGDGRTERRTLTGDQLSAGTPVPLQGREHARVTVTAAAANALAARREAQNALSLTYARLQQAAEERDGDRPALEGAFAEAMAEYRAGRYPGAVKAARGILSRLH